ncbi:MAM domain, meprin/A5/mu domain-containing protein [Ditylenchus destructor]|nr:MAM domain, meprin/A5/mu domain-containing protein [Ditylenchus destructor]
MTIIKLVVAVIATLVFTKFQAQGKSPLDCTFDQLSDSRDTGFCQWRPARGKAAAPANSALLWHTGNAVLVDSANSVVPRSSFMQMDKNGINNNRFAYVQGHFGNPTEAAIESPILGKSNNTNNEKSIWIEQHNDLKLSYWKANTSPTLDICLKDEADDELNCIDSIQGPGQQQWVRRSVELPKSEMPYRVVLRARNILSAEDIICIDDIQLVTSLISASNAPQWHTKKPPSQQFGVTNDLRRHDYNHDSDDKNENREQEDQFVVENWKEEKDVESEDAEPKDQGLVPLVQLNKFGVSQSSNAAIKPQIEQSTSTLLAVPQAQASLNGLSSAGLNSVKPSLLSPYPNIGHHQFNNNFPEFPSFPDGLNPNRGTGQTVTDPSSSCKAIKCSFLENTCQWKLGPTWKSSDGNIAKDTEGEDSVASAKFKAPLASFVEFDLWMSDDSHLMVIEEIASALPDHNQIEDVMLFSRRGMANNGWHRFRVPLRPSYHPVRVKFRNVLPARAFITLSNTRLVNGNDEEVGCETIIADPLGLGRQQHESGLWARPPAPLIGNPWQLPGPPLGSGLAFAAPAIDIRPSTTVGLIPFTPAASPLTNALPTPAPTPFNPFKPMLEDGLAPIIPLKEDPPRLTAFQKSTAIPLSQSASSFNSEEAFHGPTTNRQENEIQQQRDQNISPNAKNFQQHLTNFLPSIFGEKSFSVAPNSAFERMFSQQFNNQNLIRLRDLGPESFTNGLNKPKTLGEIISTIAGQPVLEQQLRLLAQHMGFDASAAPDARTLETLRKFLGTRLMPNVLEGQGSQSLPISVTSAKRNPAESGLNSQSHQPSPFPFESTKKPNLPLLMPLTESSSINDDDRTNDTDFSNLTPIQPVNDFNRVLKEESSQQKSPQTLRTLPGNAYFINKLATIISPPSNAADPQSPLARENLDFVFQNALNAR